MLDTAPSQWVAPDTDDRPQRTSVAPDHGAAVTRYFERFSQVLLLIPAEAISQAVSLLLEARRTGRRVYIMGNGGSATTAAHFASDLTKTAYVQGLAALRTFALTDNTALMTAWANDTAYEHIFAEQILTLVEPGDIVIAISASGNSPNVVQGLIAAASRGATTIALLGFDGGRCQDLVNVALHIPCNHYGLVEDAHSAMTHAITSAVRQAVERERDASIADLTSTFPFLPDGNAQAPAPAQPMHLRP